MNTPRKPTRRDDESAAAAETRARRFWIGFVVLLLGAPVVFNLAIVAVVTSDETFAVEPDYHAKGLAWDAELEQRRANERLGWRAGVVADRAGDALRLAVVLQDDAGRPVPNATLDVEAFALARGTERHELRLERMAPGRHEGLVPGGRPGLWEVRVAADVDGVRFTDVARVDVPEADAIGARTP